MAICLQAEPCGEKHHRNAESVKMALTMYSVNICYFMSTDSLALRLQIQRMTVVEFSTVEHWTK